MVLWRPSQRVGRLLIRAILEPAMSEPNPYEPPLIAKAPLTTANVKWQLSAGMICLLMPPALCIAGFFSTSATLVLIHVMQPSEWELTGPLLPSIYYGPPLVTLVAMLWWAGRAYRSQPMRPSEQAKLAREREA